jgi:hypothetical protein
MEEPPAATPAMSLRRVMTPATNDTPQAGGSAPLSSIGSR